MGFLRYDSDAMQAVSRAADFIILILLCVVCSVPIITIGASVTAMYYAALRMVRREEGPVFRMYFKSFRENFRQATVIWLICLAAMALLGYDWLLTVERSGLQLTSPYQLILLVVTVFVLMMVYCIFPILSRFQVTIGGAFKTAFTFAYIHPLQMLAVIAATIAPYYIGTHYLRWFLGIWVFFVGFTLYFSAGMYAKYFKVLEDRFLQSETEGSEEV
ncbi:MAG: YesL family protein [Lachnospiraceae bacterium]|nr:YesL family protein [Lachnospiraceae bacterium]